MNTNWFSKFPPLPEDFSGIETPSDLAVWELSRWMPRQGFILDKDPNLGDEFHISGNMITGGETGLLYGAYALLRHITAGAPLPQESCPRYPLRMINCWDNMDGSVERGYAGRSLFFEDSLFAYDPARLRHLGRMMASVGLNVLCINNVNVHEPAQGLLDEFLPDLSALADLFRPFGVKLMVSIDFSMPLRAGLSTADPLDPSVQDFWNRTAVRVYREVPDLAGFLVKADSEGRPGPFTYGRTHAEGANLLARALKPFGGALVWRCFVYNCRQDWRDTSVDRPMAAYDTYQPLDGQFEDNVILQIKNGPMDFQVREPLSPLLLSLQRTNLALELQLAQEYTGQQIDLYTMAPMWEDIFAELPPERLRAIAAVSNLGRDENFFGHPLAAVNFFGFGLLAWNPDVSSGEIVSQWIRLTYDLESGEAETLKRLLLESRGVYEKYTAPLGLGWMITPHTHYGPNPSGYEYDFWGTYHRASRDAVGIDRTETGTGYLAQYPPELQARYGNPAACPSLYLLFFHRLPYDFVMQDGRTLIQRIYDDHFEGAAEAAEMEKALSRLPFPEPDREEIQRRAALQRENAENWRDVINTFFHRLSGVPDERGRKIYE
ncbi:MAG: alpha-glucuronidase [Clostridiales bacterium]|nr:alpha-glucuronidase [Clostridiales bacterium]